MGHSLHADSGAVPELIIRPSTEADCTYLSTRLRQADQDEVRAVRDVPFEEVLLDGLRASDAPLTACLDGAPVCMFGVVPRETYGVIWLLGTDAISSVPVTFVRESRDWVGIFLDRYKLLTNVVDERNEASIAWLKWLGCEFVQRFPEYGQAKLPFLQFVRSADV